MRLWWRETFFQSFDEESLQHICPLSSIPYCDKITSHARSCVTVRSPKRDRFVFKRALAIYSPGRVFARRGSQGWSDPESVVNSSVALGFANLTVKRNSREEAVDRAGRARGDIPLVSKERFDDFEGRGVSNRWDRPAGRNGRGLTRRDRGRAPPRKRDVKVYYYTWRRRTSPCAGRENVPKCA